MYKQKKTTAEQMGCTVISSGFDGGVGGGMSLCLWSLLLCGKSLSKWDSEGSRFIKLCTIRKSDQIRIEWKLAISRRWGASWYLPASSACRSTRVITGITGPTGEVGHTEIKQAEWLWKLCPYSFVFLFFFIISDNTPVTTMWISYYRCRNVVSSPSRLTFR